VAGAALDEAIRQLMLLQASDWPFMIHGRDLARYGRGRFRLHLARVRRLVEVARQQRPGAEEARGVERGGGRGGFLRELSSEELRGAFEEG
jgi:1,4-alpha-glucan branching enzyme